MMLWLGLAAISAAQGFPNPSVLPKITYTKSNAQEARSAAQTKSMAGATRGIGSFCRLPYPLADCAALLGNQPSVLAFGHDALVGPRGGRRGCVRHASHWRPSRAKVVARPLITWFRCARPTRTAPQGCSLGERRVHGSL